MRLVSVSYLGEGAVLARPIINPAGQVLLQAGIKLTASYIERLKRYGFEVVFIQDDRLEDVEVHSAISALTREVAYKTIKKISEYIESDRESFLEIGQVRDAILKMIDDLLYNYDIIGNLSEIRGYDDYTFHHSVNTTILSLVMGIGSCYNENQLLELGMGVLMHDVGKVRVSDKILNKVTPLTEEEFEEIKKHTVYGYEILRRNHDISLLAAHVALQHQEKWDGSGYPRSLRGKEIHEYARIAAIGDVYEALTSKRVYRGPVEPYQAYEYIIANSGTHFDPKSLNVFARNIAVYPTGSGVLLSNAQRGNVVKQNPAFPNRPHVRMFYEKEELLNSPVDFNLAEYPSLMIIGVENK
ncbi:MAG: HD-GYP domain-containing protein [Desulfitobacteriaceae bacterium]